MSAPVIIVDYDPQWPARYETARRAILKAVGAVLESIEHVGSTSVPGLAAKPIIDIMPGIRRFEDGFECVAPLEAIGYRFRGEDGISGRHYFDHFDEDGAQGTGIQHAHMVAMDSDFWTDKLLFRDYLRANPEHADEYALLKRTLAERHRNEREDYTEGKTDFILDTLTLARSHSR